MKVIDESTVPFPQKPTHQTHLSLSSSKAHLPQQRSCCITAMQYGLPVHSIVDDSWQTGVQRHVHGEQASVLVYDRSSEVEEGESGRHGVRGDYALQYAHTRLNVVAAVHCYQEDLHSIFTLSFPQACFCVVQLIKAEC